MVKWRCLLFIQIIEEVLGLRIYEFGNTNLNTLILGGTKMLNSTVKLMDYAGKKEFDLKKYLSQLISTPSQSK